MIDLINADCIEFFNDIENNSIDLCLIDPPYGISRKVNFNIGGGWNSPLTHKMPPDMYFGEWDNSFDKLDEVIQNCYRVLKDSGYLICFYDIWKITTLKQIMDNVGFNQIRIIEWIKTNPVPVNSKLNYLTNYMEIAITGVKGSNPTFNSEYDNGIYNLPICRDKDRFHPTQKPLELIKQLVAKHSNENDLVLDCFSGSGTTAAACKLLKRNFIGCELDRHYFDKSIQRLNNIKISKAIF